jgi:hypothetical protein
MQTVFYPFFFLVVWIAVRMKQHQQQVIECLKEIPAARQPCFL